MDLETVLRLQNITKRFPGVVANDGIDLVFKKGEVHGLLGENGAGKTTLMNIVYGLYQEDEGQIYLNGERISIDKPAVAIEHGIGMVHQHFMLVEPLTVAENVVIGHEPKSRLVFPMNESVEKVEELSNNYGLIVEPRAKIEDLALGTRQRVEILKALYRRANILILDEPTAVLSPPEVEELYKVIDSLRESGKTVIFITHKLKETMTVSDRITVLRDGKKVGTVDRNESSPEELAQMMVGREVVLRVSKSKNKPGDVMLSVQDLVVEDERGVQALGGVNLDVRAGEIYGIAGIEGNGQTELVEAITGLRGVRSGDVKLLKKSLLDLSPADILKAGLGHVPEDRHKRGMVAPFSVAENLILGYHHKIEFERRGLLRPARITAHAANLIDRYDIRTPDPKTAAAALSGGNQQKMVLARALSSSPRVLVVSQPTRGVDVGATEYIHNQLLDLRNEQVAILLLSADLDEVRSLSDRIGVICQGRIVAEGEADEFTEEELGLYMAGERAEIE